MAQMRLYQYTGPNGEVMYLQSEKMGADLPLTVKGPMRLVKPRQYHVVTQTGLKKEMAEEPAQMEAPDETRRKASVADVIRAIIHSIG